MTSYICEICGKSGARMKRYTSVVGIIVLNIRRESIFHLVCDDHKVEAGRSTLYKNLLFGWWGLFAFVWNILAINEINNGGRDVTEEVELAYYLDQAKEKN